MKTEKLLGIATLIILFLVGVCFYQDRVLKKYRDVVEQIDTTSVIIKHDTIYTDVDLTVTQPIIIKETVIRTDTLYKMNEDSTVTMTPVKLKKKFIQIQ